VARSISRFCSLTFLLAVLSLLPACATRAPTSPEQVTIHESVTSAPPRFEIIKRLWVGSWTSAFGVPGYDSIEEAMADFRGHAASLGGNGVINFGCYHPINSERYICNGTVVWFL
jgi:hypothetical protein